MCLLGRLSESWLNLQFVFDAATRLLKSSSRDNGGEKVMQANWKVGERVYYIVNGKIFNSFIQKVCSDGIIMLRDGRTRKCDGLFKTRMLAKKFMEGDL